MITSKASGQSTSDSRGLQQWMQQHPLFSFFFMAYAGTWILLIPLYTLGLGHRERRFHINANPKHIRGTVPGCHPHDPLH